MTNWEKYEEICKRVDDLLLKKEVIKKLKEIAAEEDAEQRLVNAWTGFLKRDLDKEMILEIESASRNNALSSTDIIDERHIRVF